MRSFIGWLGIVAVGIVTLWGTPTSTFASDCESKAKLGYCDLTVSGVFLTTQIIYGNCYGEAEPYVFPNKQFVWYKSLTKNNVFRTSIARLREGENNKLQLGAMIQPLGNFFSWTQEIGDPEEGADPYIEIQCYSDPALKQ